MQSGRKDCFLKIKKKITKYLMLLFLQKRKTNKQKTGANKFPNIHSVFIYSACLYVAGTFLRDSDDRTHP